MELEGRRVVVANWRDLDHSMAGGAERYAWEFTFALAAAGARVEFLTAREPGQRRREERDGIRIIRGGGQLSFYPYAAWRLLRGRRRIELVIDADCGIPVFSPLFVRRSTPVILLVHHVHLAQFDLYLPRALALLGRFLERRAMPRIYRDRPTVAVSASTRAEMQRQLGWPTSVGLLPNGSNEPLPVRTDPADSVDRIVVLGRLAPHKRVDLVIRAVAALRTVRPALHLDVIGKGPDLNRLEQLVDDLDVAKHVTLHGFVDERAKADLLGRSRLQVCASDVEGWGQVVLEAASYGVPTLARNVPGLRDSVRHERTGWLLPEPSPDLGAVQARLLVGIESALDELDDEDHRTEIARDCRSWAGEHTWQAMHAGAREIATQALERGVAR